MKKRIKIIALLIASIVMLNTKLSYANEKLQSINERFVTVKFSKIKIKREDLDADKYQVEYDKNNTVAYIKEIVSNKTIEKIEDFIVTMKDGHNESHTLRTTKTVGGIDLVLEVDINLYINGSFREVLEIYGKNLYIENSHSNVYLENANVNVWRQSAIAVGYNCSGNLTSEITNSTSSSIVATLLGFGFSIGGSTSTTTYYRLPFSFPGTISLY